MKKTTMIIVICCAVFVVLALTFALLSRSKEITSNQVFPIRANSYVDKGWSNQTLLLSKTISVDGIDVLMGIYKDIGEVIVTTASIVDETQKENLDLNAMVEAVETEKAAELIRLGVTQMDSNVMLPPFHNDFSNYTEHTKNEDCYVFHSGKWYGNRGIFRRQAGVGSLRIGSIYTDSSKNAGKIVLSSTVYFLGTQLETESSGALAMPSDTAVTWRSSSYSGITYLSADLTGYATANGWFKATVSVVSTAEIQVNNSTGFVMSVGDAYES